MVNAVNAMNHPKATYVMQKLMDVADSASMEIFVDKVTHNFSWLACNPAGCRVLQKCLLMSSPDQQCEITTQLENSKTLLMLLKNKYGTHVVQVIKAKPELFVKRNLNIPYFLGLPSITFCQNYEVHCE